MNAGPGGFGNAPVSKGILITSAVASVCEQAARVSQKRLPVAIQVVSNALVLRSPGELLIGLGLLYYFRVLERQYGSHKFGAYAFVATGASYILQFAIAPVVKLQPGFPSGPYCLIFASIVQFYFSVPPSSKFSVFGWRLNDKAFVYLAGAQLLFSGGWSSVFVGGTGIAAGLLYRFNVFNIKRFRFPGFFNRFIGSTLGQLLSEQPGNRPQISIAGPAHSGHTQGPYRAPGAPGPQPQAPRAPAPAALPPPSPEHLQQLMAMGFDRSRAERALQQTNNDINQAIALLV